MEYIDDQQIEAYLRNKMTAEERRHFEDVLAADPELRGRTDELRRLMENIRQMARADTRRRVEAVRDKIRAEEEGAAEEPGPPGKRWRWILGGLALAGLLWLGYRYFSPAGSKEGGGGTPPAGIRDTLPRKPNGPIAETPAVPESPDELGQSAEAPYTSDTVKVLDAQGKATGRAIRVDQYRDTVRLYILRGDVLELYIPPWKEIPRPVVLIDRGGRVYLRLPGGGEARLEASGEALPF